MRQSPSLIALLTLSATLGIASQARSETLPDPLKETHSRTVGIAELVDAADSPAAVTIVTDTPPSAALAGLESAGQAHPTTTSNQRPVSTERRGANRSATRAATSDVVSLPIPPSANRFVGVYQLGEEGDEAASAAVVRPGTNRNRVAQAEPADDEEAPTVPIDEIDNVLEDDTPEEATEENRIEEEDPLDDATPEEAAPAEDALEEASEEALEDDEAEAEEADTETTETQVLVAEVAVADAAGEPLSPELENTVYGVITTEPGRTTTRSQIQQDINNVFATGFFANVRAVPTDTPLGVRVTFVVQPNPVLTQVNVDGSEVLPEEVVEEIFSPQYGEIINLLDFQDGILELNNWYQENGYVLAQVIAAPEIEEDGVVTLQVAEGVIEDINVRFMTDEGQTEDEDGEPIRGKTRDFIILREFETEPGDVFQQGQIQSDLQDVFGLGIFDDVTLTLNPGDKDPRQVDVTVNVIERNTGSVAAGVGFNFTGDLFGTLSYRQDNFGGNNQKFSAEAQLSTRDILFDISFTDPWIGGDPYRTSYTLNGFARRSISLVFDGGDNEIDLANGDRVRVNRYGGGVTFRRPLGNGWNASAGTLYQRIRTTDADGETFAEDAAGNPLTASDSGADDLWTVQFGVVRDMRNDPFAPTSGSVLRLGTEQSIPLGSGSIFFNRLRASYSQYFPVSFVNFSEGPQAIAVNVQGGTILGDFPPYEAFAIGGTNSVRGYDEGELGTGQSYLQASVEYRFPLFSFLGGAIFLDAGTDLGTGDGVPGSPGPDRGKPGSGFGYGAGVRVQTPLGPIRVDYGFNDQGDGRLHFGIGERF
jgi:outer membrane protein insertion porin family